MEDTYGGTLVTWRNNQVTLVALVTLVTLVTFDNT